MAQRDLTLAKKAYSTGDVELSVQAHSEFQVAPQEYHPDSGDFIKSLVFGGLDGIVTTFSVVCTVAGASLNNNIVLVMGFANLVGDGIAMGLGDYLSEQAEYDFIAMEQRRENWEMENFPDGEKKEMIEIYVDKGIKESDAKKIVDLMSKYKSFFVDHMMKEELGLMPPDDGDSPAKKGLVTFLAFVFFGSIPLLAYLFFLGQTFKGFNWVFFTSCILTVITMFLLGVAKATLARQSKFKNGCLMVLNGGVAAGSAYVVGYLIQHFASAKGG